MFHRIASVVFVLALIAMPSYPMAPGHAGQDRAKSTLVGALRHGHGGGGGGGSTFGGEEFVGPFANWINAKTGKRVDGVGSVLCTGATGNGSTDDTIAIQSCLNALGSSNPVLYFPASTYKISDVCTTATASSGATSITVASASGIRAGNYVTGTGILAPDFVATGGDNVANSYVSGTSIPLNSAIGNTLASSPVCFGLGISSQIWVHIIGHDPADTSFVWAGSSGGAMLGIVGMAYSKVSRITFDGSNAAGVIVDQTYDNTHTYFDTGNEYSDVTWKNGTIGFRCGVIAGCAETSVLRNNFTNFTVNAAVMKNFNALNLWVWYSTFTNNYVGVGNYPGAGNFNVYNSNFLNSGLADIQYSSTGLFNFRNNYSSGSNQFMRAGFTNGVDPTVLIGNIILDTTGAFDASSLPVLLHDAGPMILLNNIVARGSGISSDTLVQVGSTIGDAFSMGNTYTSSAPILAQSPSNSHSINDSIVARSAVTATRPTLPGTPPNNGRTIFEVLAGSSAATIQAAINSAVAAGTRSVVHLQGGSTYSITATLTTPANSDIQIIGDGGNTYLSCSGAAAPCLKLNGPSKVTLRDFRMTASGLDGIEVSGADQAGARVFMEGVISGSTSTTTGIFYDTLDNTVLEAHDTQVLDNRATNASGIKVVGGTSAQSGSWLGGAANFFNGLAATDFIVANASAGGHMLIDGFWYDGPSSYDSGTPSSSHRFLTATGPAATAVTISGTQPHPDRAGWINFNNFLGNGVVSGALIGNPGAGGTVTITGTATGAKNLGLGLTGTNPPFYNDTSTGATTEFLSSMDDTDAGNPSNLTETAANNTFLASVLTQLNSTNTSVPAATASGVTGVSMYRVTVEAGVSNIRIH